MKDVIRVDINKDITLYDILGNSKTLKDLSLERIDLLKHEVLFRYKKPK